MLAGSVAVADGAVVSIVTFAVLMLSTFPALSAEWYWIACAPSFVWFAGVATVTAVPAVHGPPSRRYSVVARTETLSPALRLTVTSWFCVANGASSVVVGAVLSTVNAVADETAEQRPLPALSRAIVRRT